MNTSDSTPCQPTLKLDATGQLLCGETVLLSGLAPGTTMAADRHGVGVFLRFSSPAPSARLILPVGRPAGIRRFTCCHRSDQFWMRPSAGSRMREVPVETQYLLAEDEDGLCRLFVPLLDGRFRGSLQGTAEDALELVVESGDASIMTQEVTGLFIAAGPHPHALLEQAAARVAAHLGTGRLRRDKPLPQFMDQFGWCTWDAFYREVSQSSVRTGLQSFAEGGVQPRLLILDDGWLTYRKLPNGQERLTGFTANEKFHGDLTPTVKMAKGEFGIATFLVWHAVGGYWSGVDEEALPGYSVRNLARSLSPGILRCCPEADTQFAGGAGVVPPEQILRFYHDFHRYLRQQGVDGVKVDNQGSLEGLCQGHGGRVEMTQRYHEAMEGSAHTHFRGNLINCMSCSNDVYYSLLNSNLTRSSTDFWPNQPESHGLHLYTNAQVSAWFGHFTHPDWDMFQSGHPAGAYHAAGRAVSGAPIYVSDKPGAHSFDLLRKLVLPDGSVLRAQHLGRPTRDCLFHDPTKEPVLLKIFNFNRTTAVLGVFNARYGIDGPELPPIEGSISPSDLEGLGGGRYAVYAHHAQTLYSLSGSERLPVTLAQMRYEVFTLAEIRAGFAPIGLADRFNSGGAIQEITSPVPSVHLVKGRAGGRFLAWAESRPSAVELNGQPIAFTFDAGQQALEITLPELPSWELRITRK